MKLETISQIINFLNIQEQALGKQSPEVARTVSKLADLYVKEGMLDDAEELYQRALEIQERALGPHRKEAEKSRSSLARIQALKKEDCLTEESPEEDLPHVLSTTSLDRVTEGAIDTSTCLDVVPTDGKLLKEKDIADKIKEIELEVELVKQISGNNSLQLADCLTRQADMYCRSKLYEQMEPILRDALLIRESILGTDHYLVANSLKNLARLYYFQRKFTQSKALFEAAISVRKAVFGPRHPKVAEALTQYAKLLKKMNRAAEAKQIDQEVHSIRSKHGQWHRM